MRLLTTVLSAALFATLLAGCAHVPSESDQAATYVIVRHAEKANDDARDPSLTTDGRTRASRLADSLRDAPVLAVYATSYRRTQQTALPTAQAHGLSVTTYDAGQPAADFVAQLRTAHPTGTVLVVGHSNTAPAVAAALCNCEVAPMGDDEFDRRMTVHVDATGNATLSLTRLP